MQKTPLHLAAILLALTLGLLYLPDVGHGLLRDDFAWILTSRLTVWSQASRLLAADSGFFRPLVGLSFALNYAAFGLAPFGYGLTNLLLMLATAAALFGLAKALGAPPGSALLASALWALNPHSIPMAVLWISGRTALLLTLFSLLAARCTVRNRRLPAAIFLLAALLSKEEAVLLPAVLFFWTGLTADSTLAFHWRRGLARTWPLLSMLVPYGVLRARTAAYLPSSTPAFYQPTLAPLRLLRNGLEYADRSFTIGVGLVLLLWLCSRRMPRLDPRERQWVGQGLILTLGGFGLTLFLPVRSSLYVCFPGAGAALAIAVVAGALWRDLGASAQRRLLWAGALVPILLIPTYRARARRWVTPAEVSRTVMAQLAEGHTPGLVTVIHDSSETRASVTGAFGSLGHAALVLATGDASARLWIDPPVAGSDLKPPQAGEPVRHFALRGGRLEPSPF